MNINMFPQSQNQEPQMDLTQFTDEQIMQVMQSNPQLKQQYDKFVLTQQTLKDAQQKCKPLTNKEYLKIKDIKDYIDPEGGMMIEPSSNFVIKAFDLKTNEKIFINILSHWVIDEPEQKQMVDFQNQNGIRVPMSVGIIKEDSDLKGDICKVIDIVVNPNIATNLQKDVSMRDFFCGLIQTYLMEKYKLELKQEFAFPKMKYKGKSIQFQRVKGKKPPKIQIIQEDENEEPIVESKKSDEQVKAEDEMFEQLNKQNSSTQEPEWELYLIYENDEIINYDGDYDFSRIKDIKLEINLPMLVSGRGIDLQIGSEFLCLKNGRIYELSLRFPFEINPNTVQALFTLEKRVLHIIAQPNIKPDIVDVDLTEQEPRVTQKQVISHNIYFENSLIDDII